MSTPSATPVEPYRGPSWRVRFIVLGVLVLAVGVLAVTGGLDRVPPPAAASLPTVAVNQNVDAGPWKALVTNAAATKDLGTYKPSKEGNWLLAVAVTIDVNTADSQPDFRFLNAVKVRGLPGLVDEQPLAIALVRDASRLEFINPGMPERVAFIFEVAAATPVPKQVEVVLQGHSQYFSWIERRVMWSDMGEKARLVVDVADRTEEP